MHSRADSPYSRLNYRRLIAWPERIRREWPFLENEIGRSPERSVIDLGSGTGEHARHLASEGVRSLGVDRNEAQISKAREFENEFKDGPTFIEGNLTEVGRLTDERFGLAMCLGNVLPHLDDDALAETLHQTASVLLPHGRLLIQLLNYERIVSRGIRHLPVNFREDPEGPGEIVFLRLLRADGDDRYVWFYPTTFTLEPGSDRPVEVEAAKEVRLRAWKRAELERILPENGFEIAARYGDMTGGAYDAEESADLVLAAVRAGG
ncbi:MAG: methyltransferase domain-containing protein [bacterium]|nr:methyltransferase domain-containing protein [bacterium]